MKPIITGANNVKFIQLCIQKEVDFLLVGGAAVLYYGCREEEGIPEIDILIDRSAVNAARLMTVLEQAGVTSHFSVERLQQPKCQVPLKHPMLGYNLDILTPWKEWSYSDFRARSEVGRLGDNEIRVISLEDLIFQKECVVKDLASRAEKHQKDLARLKERRTTNPQGI